MDQNQTQGGPVRWTEQAPAASSEKQAEHGFAMEKGGVTQKDIFVFAKWILGIAAGIYLILVLLHVGQWSFVDAAAMNDVWDKMTVFLNSIITLVLGLYFGAKKEDSKRTA